MLLTTSELADMRNTIAQMLPDTGYVLSASATPDSEGGQTVTWGTAATYACRIDPLVASDEAVLVAAKSSDFVRYQLTLPYTATVTTENRFRCNGVDYDIIQVDPNKSWKASTRAIIETLI